MSNSLTAVLGASLQLTHLATESLGRFSGRTSRLPCSMSEQLVVDGYNVIHSWRDLRSLLAESLELAREGLVRRLATLAQVTGTEVSVIFDAHRRQGGQHGPRATTETSHDGVRVAFTRQARNR